MKIPHEIGEIFLLPFEIERISVSKNDNIYYLKHKFSKDLTLNFPALSQDQLQKFIKEL